MIGRVKAWSDHGYGFISNSSGPDAFLHHTACAESGVRTPIAVGTWIEYDVRVSPHTGKEQAFNLRLLSDEEAAKEAAWDKAQPSAPSDRE